MCLTALKTVGLAGTEFPSHAAANSRACALWRCPLSSHICQFFLQLTEDGVLFFRESCFKPSGDKKRGNNPTHYRYNMCICGIALMKGLMTFLVELPHNFSFSVLISQ